jgi:hypothetical protein
VVRRKLEWEGLIIVAAMQPELSIDFIAGMALYAFVNRPPTSLSGEGPWVPNTVDRQSHLIRDLF